MTDAADELEIQRVLYDYAWGCDESQWELLRSLFTDDAVLDYTSTGGPADGPDEVVAWLERSLTQLQSIQHVVSNFRIDVDGDSASGRAMFYTAVRFADDIPPMITGGYYDLHLVRADGRWRMRRLYEDNRWMHPGSPGGVG